MANGKRPPPGNPGPRRRRPPTIELEATELSRGPAEAPPAQTPSQPAPAEPLTAHSEFGPRTEPAPEPTTRSAPPPPPPPRDPPRRGPASLGGGRPAISWLPPDLPWTQIGAGAVGAAGVLVVFFLLWLMGFPPSHDPNPVVALGPRLGAIETQLRELAARPQPQPVDLKPVDDLAARLAKAEAALAAPRAPATDTAVLNRLTATDEAMKALTANIVQLTRRTDAIAASLVELQNAGRTSADRGELAALASKIAALEQSNQALRDDIAKRVAANNADANQIAGLANKMAALEQSNQGLRDELAKRVVAANSDRAARLAVLAASLRGAVERGAPFAAELAAVKPLAPDAAAVTALEPFAASGVPSDVVLGRELSALIEPMRRAAGAAPPDARFIDRLQANAQKLVRIRPVEEVAGDEPSAILSRIDVKAANADVDGALDELAKLPAAMRAPAQPWIAKAQARKGALEAANRFAAETLAALKASP